MGGREELGLIALVVSMLTVTVPHILSAVVNTYVWICIKRSVHLQQQKYRLVFRQELIFNFALASVVLVIISIIEPTNVVPDEEISFRITIFIWCFFINITTVSLMLSALCRYLAVRQPMSQCTASFLQTKNLNIYLWPLVAVYTLPDTFIFMMKGRSIDFQIWGLIFKLVDWLVHLMLSLTYYVCLHLLTRTLHVPIEKQDPQFANAHYLRRGTNQIKCLFHVFLVVAITLPVLVIFALGLHWVAAFFGFLIGCRSFWALMTVAEPACFALLNKSFRDECKSVYSSPIVRQSTPKDAVNQNIADLATLEQVCPHNPETA